ncbi:helix-turn-helix transcriptional regulator [Paraburkholderia humisilvae]|uniref:Transcriptional activator NphR n=1 Tax=Paraburkholderia humisilvae TaxID=627669 RepID=A0A6J5D6H7_9BURK|nr:AraC family transcriptional regulator [Paraburkholderia humisilvae]CAB3748465.1 Transcriptional activator NphR [Paraburkholderia humisilvae]
MSQKDTGWDSGSHIFVAIVRHGSMVIRQRDIVHNFEEGSVLVLDPLNEFAQVVGKRSHFTLLRLPRSALQHRGIPCRLGDIRIDHASSPDLCAVRDYFLFLAQLAYTVSDDLKTRFAEQSLDLMDIVLKEEPRTCKRSSAAIVVLHAKQIIARLACNPDLNIARIAHEMNVSPNYLGRAFHSVGQSPMRYVTSLRLDHAARLLADETLQVKQIAFSCGFINASHFSKAFKQKYGVTPREFRTARQIEMTQNAEYRVAQSATALARKARSGAVE